MTKTSHSLGHSIAKEFYENWIRPYVRDGFPEIADRAAAVLVSNSQSLANDDELSKDHGWGPTLTLLLHGSDMRSSGRRLRHAIQRDVPREWSGEQYKGDTEDQVEVISIDAWFRREIGVVKRPRAREGWRRTRQTHLYMLRHSIVFDDSLGDFTERKSSFHFYPRDVWLSEVGSQLLMVWHHGQYNYVRRLAKRDDFVTATICLSHFVQAVMRLCMLLNLDYAPYWKWLPTEFRKQSNVAELDGMLTRLLRRIETDERVRLVLDISRDVFHRLASHQLGFEVSIEDPNSLATIHDIMEGENS